MSHVTRLVKYPHPKSQKFIVRATEPNDKNIYVLQIGASLCCKLGQLHYYKLGQMLLQIRAAITNWGKMYYKLGQVLQIRTIITNWGITVVAVTLAVIVSKSNVFVFGIIIFP